MRNPESKPSVGEKASHLPRSSVTSISTVLPPAVARQAVPRGRAVVGAPRLCQLAVLYLLKVTRDPMCYVFRSGRHQHRRGVRLRTAATIAANSPLGAIGGPATRKRLSCQWCGWRRNPRIRCDRRTRSGALEVARPKWRRRPACVSWKRGRAVEHEEGVPAPPIRRAPWSAHPHSPSLSQAVAAFLARSSPAPFTRRTRESYTEDLAPLLARIGGQPVTAHRLRS